MISGLLATLGLGALAPLIAAAAPWLAIVGGPAGGLLAFFGGKLGGKAKLIAIGTGVLLLAIAVIAATAHYEHLKGKAEKYDALEPQVSALEQKLDCHNRPADEQSLFACIPARDRDAEAARAAAVLNQQADYARALDNERTRADQHKADLEEALGLIDAIKAEDDGPLAKVMKDSWARERKRGGVK